MRLEEEQDEEQAQDESRDVGAAALRNQYIRVVHAVRWQRWNALGRLQVRGRHAG